MHKKALHKQHSIRIAQACGRPNEERSKVLPSRPSTGQNMLPCMLCPASCLRMSFKMGLTGWSWHLTPTQLQRAYQCENRSPNHKSVLYSSSKVKPRLPQSANLQTITTTFPKRSQVECRIIYRTTSIQHVVTFTPTLDRYKTELFTKLPPFNMRSLSRLLSTGRRLSYSQTTSIQHAVTFTTTLHSVEDRWEACSVYVKLTSFASITYEWNYLFSGVIKLMPSDGKAVA